MPAWLENADARQSDRLGEAVVAEIKPHKPALLRILADRAAAQTMTV